MYFSKIESLGNDFVIFGSPANSLTPETDTIKRICDRHYGIGADCAICITSSNEADFSMHVYNPDGFEAEICGNALRCSARYVTDKGFFKKRRFSVSTNSGIRSLIVNDDLITAEIGKPFIQAKGVLDVSGKAFQYISVSVGNPHCVILVPSLSDEFVLYFGRAIEHHPNFPNGTNVEFAKIINDDEIEMRVWERGIGETLSCSTGSCAVVAALKSSNYNNETIHIHQPGGTIDVETRTCGNMFITGSCKTVFTGNFND